MGDNRKRTPEQRTAVITAVSANITCYSRKAAEPEHELNWLGINDFAPKFGACEQFRVAFDRKRCADARCDRCYPDL